VEEGEEVIIARNGKPAVKLVMAEPERPQTGKRILGRLAKTHPLPPDFEERWKEHKAEIAKWMEESIFPDER
jgi:antitoxin (DNA-binding transcriptional repressor) of toxin-antitoxin stability system